MKQGSLVDNGSRNAIEFVIVIIIIIIAPLTIVSEDQWGDLETRVPVYSLPKVPSSYI